MSFVREDSYGKLAKIKNMKYWIAKLIEIQDLTFEEAKERAENAWDDEHKTCKISIWTQLLKKCKEKARPMFNFFQVTSMGSKNK